MYETRCPIRHFQPHFPQFSILCLLPLHDRTERVFRILQNYFKKFAGLIRSPIMRFKSGGPDFFDGRNAGACGVIFYWLRSCELNSRRRLSSISSGRRRRHPRLRPTVDRAECPIGIEPNIESNRGRGRPNPVDASFSCPSTPVSVPESTARPLLP